VRGVARMHFVENRPTRVSFYADALDRAILKDSTSFECVSAF
jgi:hypothetical protein